MAWIYGTVTTGNGTQKLADILSEAAIGISLQTVDAIAAAGSGYTVGDELTLSGGDFRIAAIVEVLTVDTGGEVLTVRVRNAGIYSGPPSNDVVTTGGTGSGCELECTFDHNGWVRRRAINVQGAAQSATIATAGTGYSVGDILTLVGGDGVVAATFRVATIGGGGAVATVTVVDAGAYATAPSSPVSTTGGGGSGCELTVVFGTDSSSEREIILEGEGSSGSDEIFVGWTTHSASPNFQLELAGFTAFNPGLDWSLQPGISPGRSGANGGAFVPTHALATPFWISVTNRRILFAIRTVSSYGSGHLGFLDSYMTQSEWPYPMYIAGCTMINMAGITYTTNGQFGSCVNPLRETTSGDGCANVRDPSGAWYLISNSQWSGTTPNVYQVSDTGGLTYPYAQPSNNNTAVDTNDRFANLVQTLVATTGPFAPLGGVNFYNRIFPTPNGADPLFPRFPVTVFRSAIFIFGEVHGAFAIHGAEILTPESRVKDGDRRFTVISSNNVAGNERGLWCIEEA